MTELLPAEERNPLWVKCSDCKHRWLGLYLPMAVQDAAKAMGRLTCPMCACSKILVSPDTLETVSNERCGLNFGCTLLKGHEGPCGWPKPKQDDVSAPHE